MPHYEPLYDGIDPRLTVEQELELQRQGAQQFLDATPEWEAYRSDENASLLKGWCFSRGIAISLRNLQYAFADLRERGAINPVPTPVEAAEIEPAPKSKPAPTWKPRVTNLAEWELQTEEAARVMENVDISLNVRGSGMLQKNLKDMRAADKARGKELGDLEAETRRQRVANRGEAFNLRRRQGLV